MLHESGGIVGYSWVRLSFQKSLYMRGTTLVTCLILPGREV